MNLNREQLAKAKSLGFSDRQIAHLTGRTERAIRAERKKLGLHTRKSNRNPDHVTVRRVRRCCFGKGERYSTQPSVRSKLTTGEEMKSSVRHIVFAAVMTLAVAGLALAAVAVPGLPTASAARVPGPVLRLEAAQRSITLDSFRGKVFLDPGIWTAALGSPLRHAALRQ